MREYKSHKIVKSHIDYNLSEGHTQSSIIGG